jgi:hypothetical protein
MKYLLITIFAVLSWHHTFAQDQEHHDSNPNHARVASIYISEDLINEQLKAHAESGFIRELKMNLDPNSDQIFLRGKIQIPTEELRTVNLDPKYGTYNFQLTVKLETNKDGYLILEFPLSQTYFYPSSSHHPDRDRVIVPVQMLSLALASVRGYLSALSGDFSIFDRRAAKYESDMKELKTQIRKEKDPDQKEVLEMEIEGLKLQMASVPIERRRMEKLSKKISFILGFTGEKELNLNSEISGRSNALIFKLRISQFVPYLEGVELGGIRIHHNKKDGDGKDYLVVDIDSLLTTPLESKKTHDSHVEALKAAPALIVKLNQALFESAALNAIEKKNLESKIKDLDIQLREDGLHATGGWKSLLFTIPFDAIVDFETIAQDTFEIRVRQMDVAGLNFSFLTKYVLDAVKAKMQQTLNGICTFKYVGKNADKAEAVQVAIRPQNLIPAFPNLHLINVDVRDREFSLKLGKL